MTFEIELLDAEDGDLQIVVLEPLEGADRMRWLAHVSARPEPGPLLRSV